VDLLFENSTKNEWYIPCKNCGKLQKISWFDNVVRIVDIDRNDYELYDKDWTEDCNRDIKAICKYCGGELDRKSLECNWHEEKPKLSVSGYHISQLMLYWIPIKMLYKEFNESLGNEIKMQHFFNSRLGEAYTGIGFQVTSTILSNCIDEDWLLPMKYEGLNKVTMGVDVGNDFDVRISEIVKDERKMLWVAKVKTKEELFDLMRRYKVQVCVIDAKPEKRLVEEIIQEVWQRNLGLDVWMCYRFTNSGEVQRKNIRVDFSKRVIEIDRTYILDISLQDLKSGKNILPKAAEQLLSGKYYEEMQAPVRKLVENTRGHQYYIWTKGNDHQRDSDTYDIMAGFEQLRTGGVRTL